MAKAKTHIGSWRGAMRRQKDPARDAALTSLLPWIAAVLHKTLPDDEYRAFAQQLKENMQMVYTIAGAENPSTAFDEAFAAAKKQVN